MNYLNSHRRNFGTYNIVRYDCNSRTFCVETLTNFYEMGKNDHFYDMGNFLVLHLWQNDFMGIYYPDLNTDTFCMECFGIINLFIVSKKVEL